MVIPARWFAGGKGLDEFRESMLTDDRLRSIDDYLSASDVFPGVGLKGGVCYFLWDRDNPGPCRVTTHFKDWPVSTAQPSASRRGRGRVHPLQRRAVDPQEGRCCREWAIAVAVLPENKRFDRLVSSREPFGLRHELSRARLQGAPGDVLVYQNGGTGYIPRSSITTGADLIDKWKIYVGRAAPGTGNRDTYPHRIISTPFIGEPGSISSETYLCIGPFDSKSEAESVLSYLSCRLTRLLILLHKPSQDTTRKVYTFVPTQEWTRQWTDEDLYAKYGLSASEIALHREDCPPDGPHGDLFEETVSDDDE